MISRLAGFVLLLQLTACAVQSPVLENAVLEDTDKVLGISQWQHMALPGKRATDYVATQMDGRDVLAVHSESSASMMRQKIRVLPDDLGQVQFSWKVPELIAQADMALRNADDSPVRIVLAFEGDRSRFSAKNAMLSELSNLMTGEPLPYATLMYVWCNTRAPGSVIVNPRTDRIRKLVVESGGKNLNQWLDYERDIRADYERVFGEPPGALVGVGIMTDTDNTHTATRAWYGQPRLSSGKRMTKDTAGKGKKIPQSVLATLK
ncbi:MAG: DUF3047 domain-containing protein [Rhodoferax sp.]|nr:DUF3047 domain-containing protein [Rhodoferax sp.]